MLNESLVSADKGDQIVLNGQKSMADKMREMRLAIELEKKYTKDQILEGYLNIVFFNRDAYGIEAASRYFFSTTAKDLTLPQAALLAGLVNSPSFYDPAVHPENAIQRRNQVLDSMLSEGKITQAEHDAAAATGVELKITPGRQGCAGADMAPYFCDYVSHLILNNPAYGADVADREQKLYRGGLTITTTLDSRLQAAAQAQVDATAGANPDKWGAVAGLHRSPAPARSWPWRKTPCSFPQPGKFDTQLNFNVDSKDANGNDLNGAGGFQPGSTMKPFTFAEWLNEGKSLTADGGRLPADISAGVPLEVQLRQGARRLQHAAEEAGSAPRTTSRTTTPATTAACPSTTGSTTPSTPQPSPRPPSWTSAESRRWWTPSGSTAAWTTPR